jgi:hypothetical protein
MSWLHGGEVFGIKESDVNITEPQIGPTQGLPPGIGAIKFQLLLPETKLDATLTADVVIAFTTLLLGLSLGTWLGRLSLFQTLQRQAHLLYHSYSNLD